MSKKRTFETTKNNVRYVWRLGARGSGEVLVDAYLDGAPAAFMEWAYPTTGVCGHNLSAAVAFWREQAELQASAEQAEASTS